MKHPTTTNLELCPRCHASIALTPYVLPFEEDLARAYRNPSKADSSAIESGFTEVSAELTTVAQEIQRVEFMLNALKKHHAQLDRDIHRTTHYIQASPIRQLPTEVLSIIFASACTSFQKEEYKTPLSISLVCSKWRDIAMSTPSLWTNIYVAPDSRYDGPLFDYYCERNESLPVSIKVEVPGKRTFSDDFDDDCENLLWHIFCYCYDWKHAELRMHQETIQLLEDHTGMRREGPSLPLLESLTLAIEDLDLDNLPRIFNYEAF